VATQTSARPVRQQLQARHQPHRSLDERLAIRFPGLAARQARWLGSLPPQSRMRKAIVARAVTLGIEAYNRRDLPAVVAGWDPEFEYIPGRRWIEAGLAEEGYRGLPGYREYIAATEQVWGRENQLAPLEVVDAGDRILIVGEGRMRAQASGVPLEEPFALLMTLRTGRPIRLEEYYDHDEALRAIGVVA
jgi:ketosteroid isomerase-like protein